MHCLKIKCGKCISSLIFETLKGLVLLIKSDLYFFVLENFYGKN